MSNVQSPLAAQTLDFRLWTFDDKDNKEIPLKGVSCVLINSEDVQWVEFMEKTWEQDNVNEGPESTTAVEATSTTDR